MLVLSRKLGESIQIADNISVTVCRVGAGESTDLVFGGVQSGFNPG